MDQIHKINISDFHTLASIDLEFNRLFPYLRLEFYKDQVAREDVVIAKEVYDYKKTVNECTRTHIDGCILLNPLMLVSDLENLFKLKFGLSARVLRKFGNTWMPTVYTSEWTLDQQNKIGEQISIQLNRDFGNLSRGA